MEGLRGMSPYYRQQGVVHAASDVAGENGISDMPAPCGQLNPSSRSLPPHDLVAISRGSDLEEGESQGLPAWSRHVGDPILASNITRRVDYALFMVEALRNDALIHEAPAIVGCRTTSALTQTTAF